MIKRRIRQLFSLSIGLIKAPFYKKEFQIKRGYIHRKKKKEHFSAAIYETDEAQKEVYEITRQHFSKNDYSTVVDVGCGSAYKLIKQFEKIATFTGIDIKTTYEHLIKTYPQHNWLDGENCNFEDIHADLAICSDVIEHVENPSALLSNIKKIKGLKALVVSTSDRLLARGWFDYGPPANPTHMREWNGKEFAKFMESEGFTILTHQVTRYDQHTQMIICKPKNTSE